MSALIPYSVWDKTKKQNLRLYNICIKLNLTPNSNLQAGTILNKFMWKNGPDRSSLITIVKYLNIAIAQYCNIPIMQCINIPISKYLHIAIFQYLNIPIPTDSVWQYLAASDSIRQYRTKCYLLLKGC